MVIAAQNIEQKPGYKQSEIGMIPEDWDFVELGTVIDYIKGFPFKSADYQSDGIQIIRVSDTTFDSIKDVNQVYIERDKSFLYAKWTLKEDDLILSTVGSKPPMYDSMVGKVIIIEKKYDGTLLNQNAVLVRAKKRTPYKQKLLLNHLRTKRYLNYIELIYRGNANQASITLNDLFHFQLALPHKDIEQQAIATALSDVDALISSLNQLIAKKRDIKQAAMQQLLTGKTRLPGFSEEWKVRKLGEICEFYSGGTPNTSNSSFYGGSIRWITSSDLNKERIREVEGRITKLGLEKSSATMVKKGTLLLALYGATAGIVAITELNAAINQAVLAIIPQKDSAEFLFQKLTLLKDWLIKTYTQGGQPNLSGQIVKSIELSLPSKLEQQAIANVLSDMDAEIVALEQRREKTRALKQGMMQELLSGKTRLL